MTSHQRCSRIGRWRISRPDVCRSGSIFNGRNVRLPYQDGQDHKVEQGGTAHLWKAFERSRSDTCRRYNDTRALIRRHTADGTTIHEHLCQESYSIASHRTQLLVHKVSRARPGLESDSVLGGTILHLPARLPYHKTEVLQVRKQWATSL